MRAGMERQLIARWVLVGMALLGLGALAVAFGAALGPGRPVISMTMVR